MTTHHSLDLAGFIETVPAILGYIPREMLVMTGIQSGRVTLTTCCDLRDVNHDEGTLYRTAESLERTGATDVILCAWTEGEDFETDERLRVASDIANLFGMHVHSSVQVTNHTVRRLPDASSSTDALLPRDPSAAAPIGTKRPLNSRTELQATIEAGPQARALPATHKPGEPAVALAWMTFVIGDEATPVSQATDEQVATLAAVDQHIDLRDAILESLCPMGDDRPSMPTPQVHDVMNRMIEVAHRLPDEPDSAGVLAMLALTAWRLGEGATANIASERARRLNPEHTLTALVRHLLALTIRPPMQD